MALTIGRAVGNLCVLSLLLGSVPVPDASAGESHLELVRTIALPGISGRIDHMTIDAAGKRLFVAALASNSVLVVDLEGGSIAGRIAGVTEPQGVAYLSGAGQVAVSSGGDGSCRFYDAQTLREISSADFRSDADNLRFDETQGKLYVGFGSGGIGIIDVKTGTRLADIPLTSHPEAFEMESLGSRAFVNLPATSSVAVVDRDKHNVLASWALPAHCENFPMALDQRHHRLFVGCRNPPQVVVLDTESGATIASFDCVADVDDLFLDGDTGLLYASGGEGFLDVFAPDGKGWRRSQRIVTSARSRTSLLAPASKRLYLAIPSRGSQPAEIRVYEPR
ncbi:MAG TPA: hypothetical protein VGK20_12500 [Candidatus Binatia bacterium]|jgi:WD40 repeat protein